MDVDGEARRHRGRWMGLLAALLTGTAIVAVFGFQHGYWAWACLLAVLAAALGFKILKIMRTKRFQTYDHAC